MFTKIISGVYLYEIVCLWVGFKLRWSGWLLTLAYGRELIHSCSKKFKLFHIFLSSKQNGQNFQKIWLVHKKQTINTSFISRNLTTWHRSASVSACCENDAQYCDNISTIAITNAHNCHLIQNNIFKNIKLLHVSVLTGPSSWIPIIVVL